MFSFERMTAWQKAAEWSDLVFDIADRLPQRLQFSFGEQLCRACLSVTNNLAEGSGKRTPSSQRSFYDISHGSIYESVSIMAILRRKSLIDANEYEVAYAKADEIAALIYGLIQAATAAESKARALRESEPDYQVGDDGRYQLPTPNTNWLTPPQPRPLWPGAARRRAGFGRPGADDGRGQRARAY